VTLGEETLTIIALASAAVSLLALVVALALGRKLRLLRRMRARQQVPEQPAELRFDARDLAYEIGELREAVAHAVQRVGIVRFDAFEDLGGQLSFAAALLDAAGDGIVLSSINGRTETRIYAKPVERGSSRYNLSGEEEEAIRRALGVVHR
jgi:hypothetical protein